MITATQKATAKRTRGKSDANEESFELRLETRHKWSGGFTVQCFNPETWLLRIVVSDSACKEAFEIDFDRASPYSGRERAISDAFLGLIEWADELRLKHPKHAARLAELPAALRTRAAQFPGVVLSNRGIPETQAEAAEKEAAATDWTCRCGTIRSYLASKCDACGDQIGGERLVKALAAAHQAGEQKAPKKSKRSGKAAGAAQPAQGKPGEPQHLETRDVALSDLRPHPDNPRSAHFQIEDLVQSLQVQGQLTEALGRPHPSEPGAIELLAGHRRFAAAEQAGWTTLRVRIIAADDAQAIEILGRDNEDRQNFTALERARWYRAMLDELGISQRDLSERLGPGHSQGNIANALALLNLTPAWHELLQAGKIAATHTRVLTQFNGRPELLDKLAAKYSEAIQKDNSRAGMSVKQMEDWTYDRIRDCSRSFHCGWNKAEVRVTDKNREELDIIKIPQGWGGVERRALNTRAFDRLQKEAQKRMDERKKKEQAAAATSPSKATPAAFDKWKVDEAKQKWLDQAIAGRVEKLSPKKDQPLLLRLLLLVSKSQAWSEISQTTEGPLLGGVKTSWDKQCRVIWERISGLDPTQINMLVRDCLAATFRESADSFERAIEDPAVHAQVAELLGIDFAEQWRPTAEVLELYDDATLRKLPAAKRVADQAKATDPTFKSLEKSLRRADLIPALVNHWLPGELPPGM